MTRYSRLVCRSSIFRCVDARCRARLVGCLEGRRLLQCSDHCCNIIAPFICAPRNRNESPLLRDALLRLTQMAHAIGMDLQGSTVSLDSVYDCRATARPFSTGAWCPTFRKIRASVKRPKRGRKQRFDSLRHTLARRLTSRHNVGQLVLSGKHPRWEGVMKLDGTKARSYCTVIPCRDIISTQG